MKIIIIILSLGKTILGREKQFFNSKIMKNDYKLRVLEYGKRSMPIQSMLKDIGDKPPSARTKFSISRRSGSPVKSTAAALTSELFGRE